MRWWVLVFILVMPLFASLVPAVAEPVSNNTLGAVSETNVIVHRGETVSTYVTVHNTASETQTVTVESGSNHSELTVIGLPRNQTMAANHLQQFTFQVTASNSTPFREHNLTLRIVGDGDPLAVLLVNMSILVAPYSNLSWGASGVSQFIVDETVRTSVAVNMTNGANVTDHVTFSLSSPSMWSWGWNMEANEEGLGMLNLSEGQLGYVYLWVDVPAVVNGAPLAGTGPRFTLTGVSGLDMAAHTWQFDLLVNGKRNVSIDHVENNLTLSPSQDGRMEVTVRNVGNTVNNLNISLIAVDEDEQPLPGLTKSDRFNTSGWTVALFGGLENVPLSPNESRVVEIGIQAPNDLQGELRVKMFVFAQGATALQREVVVSATIQRNTGAELQLLSNGCTGLNEINNCTVETAVTNTGNSYNSFTVRAVNITDGFATFVTGMDGAFFLPAQQKDLAMFTVTSRPELLAFTTGSVDIEVVDDTGAVVASQSVELRISPLIRWNLTVVEETVDQRGRLSMAVEVRNDGNAEDGLLIQLQSSHAVTMSLIPPEGAIFEEGVMNPRSMELRSTPIGSTFTVRAWAELPQDQSSNGTMYINTTLRSRYTPEDTFVYTAQADYLGIPWQEDSEGESGASWTEGLALSVAYLKAWSGVLLASGCSVALIMYAVRARQRRENENALLPYQQVPETPDDWMAKFDQKTPETQALEPTIAAATMSGEDYAAQFRLQHGHAAVQQPAVESKLVNAAQLVLEKRSEERELQRAGQLLQSIASGQVAAPIQDIPVALSSNNQQQPVELPTEATPLPPPVLKNRSWQDDDLDF